MADIPNPEKPVPATQQKVIDYRQIGNTGLQRFGGFVYEEFLQELVGWSGARIYKEMGANDATITAILFTIDKLCRRVPWRVQPASEHPNDVEAAEFLEQCMNDMDTTWIDTISEILSMLQYGYSVHEILYKKRLGEQLDPILRSKYRDGRIGWRGFPIRSQDTIWRWQFDDHGGIQGCIQMAPPDYQQRLLPIQKLMLFRTTTHKNNPEGLSILRGAYRSWYMKKNIENIEAIGIERDLAGLPMMKVPAEIMMEGASPSQQRLLAELKKVVTNVRRDEQEGLLIPSDTDEKGKELYSFELLSTGGSRQFDVDKTINRYDQRIAMSCLMDFMLLGGQNSSGSWAMHTDKTKLAAMALGAFLDIIAENINRFGVTRLFAVNSFQISDYPKIVHGDIESVDLKELGDYLLKLAQAGAPLFPNEELEKYVMKAANLPEPPKTDQPNPQINPMDIGTKPGEAVELTDENSPGGSSEIPISNLPGGQHKRPAVPITNSSSLAGVFKFLKRKN